MKKNMKTYGICIGGMLLLVAVALLLPQIVFTIQDRHRMISTEVEIRNSLTVSQVNSIYEKQMCNRMSKLAAMDLETANITAIDYDIREEAQIEVLLERIFNQEWMEALNDMTLYSFGEMFEIGYKDVKKCKKYIVYGNDYQEGVALMMWYFDLYMTEIHTRIRILVDSETDSIYYIKITASDEQIDKGNIAYDTTIGRHELLHAMTEQILFYIDFYCTYYEGEKLEHLAEINVVEQQCTIIKYPFSFGEISLDFLVQAVYGSGKNPDISIGISNIANLIPEMIQD